MEPPFKLKDLDHFSNLPDHIFHQILSWLDIKDLGRIATLSRRCRALCFPSPFLNIKIYKTIGDHKFHDFIEFLDRFMSSDNVLVLRQFHLCVINSMNNYDMAFHIGEWLVQASRCNIEKISLEMSLSRIQLFTLPSAISNCASLKSLKLDFNFCKVKLPNVVFSALEDLSIIYFVYHGDKPFSEWISTSCKSLKRLELQCFFGIKELNIRSLYLEHIIIKFDYDFLLSAIKVSAVNLEFLHVSWTFNTFLLKIYAPNHTSKYPLLEIDAPNLKRFYMFGNVPNYSYQGNFEHMEASSLRLYSDGKEYRTSFNLDMAMILQTVAQSSSFEVTEASIKMMMSANLQLNFDNLKTLTLQHVIHEDIAVPETTYFLKLAPNLRTLMMKTLNVSHFNERCSNYENSLITYDVEYWESQDLRFVESLEEVVIESEGSQNQQELIKYLLKNGAKLKTITIYLLPHDLLLANMFGGMFHKSVKASSSVVINILPRAQYIFKYD